MIQNSNIYQQPQIMYIMNTRNYNTQYKYMRMTNSMKILLSDIDILY